MRRPGPTCAIALLAVLAAAAAGADEPTLEVHLNPQRLGIQDVTRLTISISGGKLEGGPPRPAKLSNLEIVGGPSTEQQFSWVNGVASSSTSFVYVLQPLGLGAARVGAMTVRVAGKDLTSAPIDAEVVQGSLAPPQRRQQLPWNPLNDLMAPRSQRRVRAELRLLTPKAKLYLGESMTATIVLETTADVDGFQWVDPPSFPGWWVQRVQLPQQVSGTLVDRAGMRLMRYPVARYVIIPLKAGVLKVPQASARIGVGAPSLFGPGQVLERATAPRELEVMQRPLAPAGFSGAVGQLSYAGKVSSRKVRVGDSLTITVSLTGNGNLPLVSAPVQWPSCSTCESYPPEENSSVKVDGDGIHGTRSWSKTMVPRQWGDLRLPAVTLSVFDPVSATYRRQAVGPFTVAVTPAPATPTPTPQASFPRHVAAGSVRTVEHPPSVPTPVAEGAAPWKWVLGALAVGVFLGAATVLFVRRRRRARIPRPAEGQSTAERARELQGVLERWWSGTREVDRTEAREEQVTALRRELEGIRFAPGRADHTETVRELEEKLRRLLRGA
ncbi:MAG: BatD family protein [Acidobacteria bacterium]|nr:BatD family protein [Acidobacteriota bacterium]